MVKGKKVRRILAVISIVCLLAALFGLLACGGGTLTVNETSPSFVLGFPSYTNQEDYEVYMGLRIHCVTVAAATPWGILVRCDVPSHYMAQWYEKDSKEYEVTKYAVTRWVFLRPGDSFLIYLDDKCRTDDGTFWTFTYFKD